MQYNEETMNIFNFITANGVTAVASSITALIAFFTYRSLSVSYSKKTIIDIIRLYPFLKDVQADLLKDNDSSSIYLRSCIIKKGNTLLSNGEDMDSHPFVYSCKNSSSCDELVAHGFLTRVIIDKEASGSYTYIIDKKFKNALIKFTN